MCMQYLSLYTDSVRACVVRACVRVGTVLQRPSRLRSPVQLSQWPDKDFSPKWSKQYLQGACVDGRAH